MSTAVATSTPAGSTAIFFDPVWEFDCPKFRDFRNISGQRPGEEGDDDDEADSWFEPPPTAQQATQQVKLISKQQQAQRRSVPLLPRPRHRASVHKPQLQAPVTIRPLQQQQQQPQQEPAQPRPSAAARPAQHVRHKSHPVLPSTAPLSSSAPTPRTHRIVHNSDSALLICSAPTTSSAAVPAPASAPQTAAVAACRPSVTVPRSPHLSTSCRVHQRTSTRHAVLSGEEAELRRMEAERELIRRRIAANKRMVEKLFSLPPQPPPTLKAVTTVRSQTVLTRPAPLALHTANRVQSRQERRKGKVSEQTAATVIHALPLPAFDCVFVPARSALPLTTPRSPPLATALRATARATAHGNAAAGGATGANGAQHTAAGNAQRLTKRDWR